MAKRKVRWKVGDVVSIPLSGGQHGYAWMMESPLMAFFDYRSFAPVPVEELVKKPIAFKIWVMRHTVTDGLWPVVGHASVPATLLEPPEFFKQDPLNGKLSITHDGGDERPATLEECQHLECAAVWEPRHVVDRLEDHFAGRKNRWVESLRPKAVHH